MRVQQTAGQRSNKTGGITDSTYWCVIVTEINVRYCLLTPPFCWQKLASVWYNYCKICNNNFRIFCFYNHDNIKASGCGNTYKWNYEILPQRSRILRREFDSELKNSLYKIFYTWGIHYRWSSDNKNSWCFAFLIPLSATEHTPEIVYPSRIITLYCPQFLPSTFSCPLLQFHIP